MANWYEKVSLSLRALNHFGGSQSTIISKKLNLIKIIIIKRVVSVVTIDREVRIIRYHLLNCDVHF